jgi:hypothetical protein
VIDTEREKGENKDSFLGSIQQLLRLLLIAECFENQMSRDKHLVEAHFFLDEIQRLINSQNSQKRGAR